VRRRLESRQEDSRFEWLGRSLAAALAPAASSNKGAKAIIQAANEMSLSRGDDRPDTGNPDDAPWRHATHPTVPEVTPLPTVITDEYMERLSREATARALAKNGVGSAERFARVTRPRD
jgi:hypothetical protein